MSDLLRELLQSGSLGKLELGLPRFFVREYLGSPSDWSSPNSELAAIRKYGSLLIFFDKGVVTGFGIYYGDPETDLLSMFGDEVYPGHVRTLPDLEAYLAENQVKYEVVPELTFDSQKCLESVSRVRIFVNTMVGTIESIQKWY